MIPTVRITLIFLFCCTWINAQPYEPKNVSRLTVLLNSGEGNQFKQCAEPLTAYTFPNKKKDAMGYHLLNLARSDYSVPDLVQRRKQLKQKGEPVACLVNTTQLNTLFYLLDPDLLVVDIQSSDPDVYLTDKLTRSSASIIRLSRNNFGRLLKSIPPGPYSNWTTFIYRKSITSYTPGLQILATLVVQLFGLLALITGCALVVPRQERIAKHIVVGHNLCESKGYLYLVLGFFVAQAFIMILVTFYYAKYLIVLSVIAFAVFGIISMAYVGRCVYCSRFERNFGPFNVQLFGIQKEIHISLMYLIVIPLSIAFGLLWFALRQDPRIGYPLQCILATFIVQFVLSYDFILPSMKQLSILFLFVLPFEIVDKIVFPMLNIADGKSIIETLLSHSLGFDGSSLPGGFRISVAHFTGWENGNCSYLEYNGLLPFAHVLLPGLICALFMLHDCQQQVRYCRNFSASVIGYILGQVMVHFVRIQSGRVHPALLYLVPCTLIPPLVVALVFGGLSEVRRLWTGQFLDEDHDLDQLREKRFSQISVLSVIKDVSLDSE